MKRIFIFFIVNLIIISNTYSTSYKFTIFNDNPTIKQWASLFYIKDKNQIKLIKKEVEILPKKSYQEEINDTDKENKRVGLRIASSLKDNLIKKRWEFPIRQQVVRIDKNNSIGGFIPSKDIKTVDVE